MMEYRFEPKNSPSSVFIEFKEDGVTHSYSLLAEDVRGAQEKLTNPEWMGEVMLRLTTPAACTGDFAALTMQHIILVIEGRTARFTYFTDKMVTRTFGRNDLIRCFRNMIKQLNKDAG